MVVVVVEVVVIIAVVVVEVVVMVVEVVVMVVEVVVITAVSNPLAPHPLKLPSARPSFSTSQSPSPNPSEHSPQPVRAEQLALLSPPADRPYPVSPPTNLYPANQNVPI